MEMYILHLSDIHYREGLGSREGEGGRCMTGKCSPIKPGGQFPAPEGYQNMLSAMQNPLIFLDECLNRVAENREKINLIVITGDLTEDGTAEDYRCLKRHIQMKTGDIPVVVTLGNHDNKKSFREGWLGRETAGGSGSHDACNSAPYHAVERVEGTVVISFDTSLQGVSDGCLDEERLDWLRSALEEAGNRPSILVTHHHLLPEQGQIPPLPGGKRLLSLIENSGVLCIFCGHTHHHYSGLAAGRPYYIADSLSFCGDDIGGGHVRFQEKYGYNIYRMEEGMVRMCRSETFANGRILGTLVF